MPSVNDHVSTNQGGSDTNQGNGNNRRHTKGQKQKNIGENEQLVQHQSINFTGADESFKVLLSPTERRGKV